MTVFAGAVDATLATLGVDAVYTPAGGEPIPVWVIARRPDTIVDFGETRIRNRDRDVRGEGERGRKPAPR